MNFAEKSHRKKQEELSVVAAHIRPISALIRGCSPHYAEIALKMETDVLKAKEYYRTISLQINAWTSWEEKLDRAYRDITQEPRGGELLKAIHQKLEDVRMIRDLRSNLSFRDLVSRSVSVPPITFEEEQLMGGLTGEAVFTMEKLLSALFGNNEASQRWARTVQHASEIADKTVELRFIGYAIDGVPTCKGAVSLEGAILFKNSFKEMQRDLQTCMDKDNLVDKLNLRHGFVSNLMGCFSFFASGRA